MTSISWRQLVITLLVLLAIIGSASYGAFGVASPFGWLAHPESRVAVFLVGAIVGELLAFWYLAWRLNRYGMNLRSLGLWKLTNRKGMILGLIVAVLYGAFTAIFNPLVGSHLLQFTVLKVLAIIAALVAGLVEETIFRGFVMTSLESKGHGKVTQVLFSAATFAVAHFYGFVSLPALLITFGLTFILGAALAIVYLVGNRSLTPVIISHALVDLIIEPWLLLGFFTAV